MSFESDLRKAERELEKKIGDIFRLTTIDVMNSVIILSPVLSGQFRHNWQATTNEKGTGFVLGANKSIPKAEQMLTNVKLSDIMFLTNNLPYAETLVDNPSPRWIEKQAANAQDYMLKRINEAVS